MYCHVWIKGKDMYKGEDAKREVSFNQQHKFDPLRRAGRLRLRALLFAASTGAVRSRGVSISAALPLVCAVGGTYTCGGAAVG